MANWQSLGRWFDSGSKELFFIHKNFIGHSAQSDICVHAQGCQMRWASGAMDNASDYGSEDSRFDSWLARSTSFTLLSAHSHFIMRSVHNRCDFDISAGRVEDCILTTPQRAMKTKQPRSPTCYAPFLRGGTVPHEKPYGLLKRP